MLLKTALRILAKLSLPAVMLAVVSCPPVRADEVADYERVVEQRWPAWREALWKDAEQQGVTRATFDKALSGVSPNWSLPDLTPPDPAAPGGPALPASMRKTDPKKHQPEFDAPARYFPAKSIDSLAAIGRKREDDWKTTLAQIEKRFGVPGNVVLAIWGRETSFGTAKIPYYAIEVLATQAFIGRRPDFFREQLLVGLKILQEEHITPERMKSSWAGAMGYTQFMPRDFARFAVDFDGDGHRDIWGSIGDALASTANYLKQSGWQSGKTWGYEVTLPAKFDCTLEGPDKARPIKDWVGLGAKRTFDRPFPAERLSESAFLMMPAGLTGPAFLALNNFTVLKAYNTSDLYALYVGHLSDRLVGGGAFAGVWRPVDRFLRDDILDLQKVLAGQGHDVGKLDGLAGWRTRVAIGLYQKKLKLASDCYPNRALLQTARAEQGSDPGAAGAGKTKLGQSN